MKAHIIVDEYRPMLNLTVAEEILKQDIDHQFWKAVHEPESVIASIGKSHKQIVEYAKRTGLSEVCIMEEDVWFPAKDGWLHFLKNKPADYDLYLSGVYGLHQGARDRLQREGPGALSIHNFAGLHCYIIHETYYDRFLSIPESSHIDDQPGMGQFFVCFPFAALQHPGWSANNGRECDYNTTIPEDYVYRG